MGKSSIFVGYRVKGRKKLMRWKCKRWNDDNSQIAVQPYKIFSHTHKNHLFVGYKVRRKKQLMLWKCIQRLIETILAMCKPTNFFRKLPKRLVSSATVWRQKHLDNWIPRRRYQAAKYSEDRSGGAGAYQAWKYVLKSNKAFWQELYCCGAEVKKE